MIRPRDMDPDEWQDDVDITPERRQAIIDEEAHFRHALATGKIRVKAHAGSSRIIEAWKKSIQENPEPEHAEPPFVITDERIYGG